MPSKRYRVLTLELVNDILIVSTIGEFKNKGDVRMERENLI